VFIIVEKSLDCISGQIILQCYGKKLRHWFVKWNPKSNYDIVIVIEVENHW